MRVVNRIYRHYTDPSNYDRIEWGHVEGNLIIKHQGAGTWAPSRHIAAEQRADEVVVTVMEPVDNWDEPDPMIILVGVGGKSVRLACGSRPCT